MLERGERLHEDSGVYETRDRAEVGLRRCRFLYHAGGRGNWRLRIE